MMDDITTFCVLTSIKSMHQLAAAVLNLEAPVIRTVESSAAYIVENQYQHIIFSSGASRDLFFQMIATRYPLRSARLIDVMVPGQEYERMAF